MSTRSLIATTFGSGYRAIYCHYDGYPEGVGATLLEHYNDAERARDLVALGDISSLHPKLMPDAGAEHSFDSPAKDVTVAYGRDRGETGTEAAEVHDLAQLRGVAKDCGAEWLYVWDGAGWLCAKGGVSAFGMPANKAPGELRPIKAFLASKGAS